MNQLLFDVGGTFVKYAYISKDSVKIDKFAVADRNGNEDLPGSLRKFLENFKDVDTVGFSVPGPFDLRNGIGLMTEKLTSIYKFSLKNLILEFYPSAKIIFIHDAVAFALGVLAQYPEYMDKDICCAMMGTGLGYAYSKQGKIAVDKDRFTLPDLGWKKYLDSNVEGYVSATALLKRAKENGYNFHEVKDMAIQARAGDNNVKKIFFDVGVHLGIVLNEQNKYQSFKYVFIGGGVARAFDLLKDGFTSKCSLPYIVVDDPTLIPLKGIKIAIDKGETNIYL